MVLNVNQWLLHEMFPEWMYKSIFHTIWNKSTLIVSTMVGPEAKITISNRVSTPYYILTLVVKIYSHFPIHKISGTLYTKYTNCMSKSSQDHGHCRSKSAHRIFYRLPRI